MIRDIKSKKANTARAARQQEQQYWCNIGANIIK
jgi:hypothetical protein